MAFCTNFRDLSQPPIMKIRRKGPESEGLTQVKGSQEWGYHLTSVCSPHALFLHAGGYNWSASEFCLAILVWKERTGREGERKAKTKEKLSSVLK